LMLACAATAACASHKPLCQGPLRPINVAVTAAAAHPGGRHGE